MRSVWSRLAQEQRIRRRALERHTTQLAQERCTPPQALAPRTLRDLARCTRQRALVQHGTPLVLARCTRRRALVQHRTRLVRERCTRRRELVRSILLVQPTWRSPQELPPWQTARQ